MEELEIPEAIYNWLDSDEFSNAIDKFCEAFLVPDEKRGLVIDGLVKFINKKINLSELVLKLTMVAGEEAAKADANIKKFLYDNLLSPIESYLWLINIDLLEVGGKEKDERKIRELKALEESVYEEESSPTPLKPESIIEKNVIAPENVPLTEEVAPMPSLKNNGAPVMLHEFKEEVHGMETKYNTNNANQGMAKPSFGNGNKSFGSAQDKKQPVKVNVSGFGARVVHYNGLMTPITQATLVAHHQNIGKGVISSDKQMKIPKPQSKWFR